jgi:hypothetical protein
LRPIDQHATPEPDEVPLIPRLEITRGGRSLHREIGFSQLRRLAPPLLAIALAGCSGSADSSSTKTKTVPPEFAGDPKIEEIYKSGKSDAEIRKAVIGEIKSRGRTDAGKAKGKPMQ